MKKGKGQRAIIGVICLVSFSAFTLFVGRQERHLARKKIVQFICHLSPQLLLQISCRKKMEGRSQTQNHLENGIEIKVVIAVYCFIWSSQDRQRINEGEQWTLWKLTTCPRLLHVNIMPMIQTGIHSITNSQSDNHNIQAKKHTLPKLSIHYYNLYNFQNLQCQCCVNGQPFLSEKL